MSIAISPIKDYFATIGTFGSNINIWDSKKFVKLAKLFCLNSIINKLKFSPSGNEIIVSTKDCKVLVYPLNFDSNESVNPTRELRNTHKSSINDFIVTKNEKFLITVGSDCLIKVWDYFMRVTHGP